MAVRKAGAEALDMPLYRYVAKISGNTGPMALPVPCFNVINGSHAGNKLAFQEYFIPVGAETFKEAMRIGAECPQPQVDHQEEVWRRRDAHRRRGRPRRRATRARASS